MAIPMTALPDEYQRQAQRQMIEEAQRIAPEPGIGAQAKQAAAGEEDVHREHFEQWCRFRGFVYWHVRRADLAPELDGMPDDIVHLPGGRMALIEFKTAKGKLRKSQIEKFTELSGLGHIVHVCRSLDEAMQAVALEMAGQGKQSPFAFGAGE